MKQFMMTSSLLLIACGLSGKADAGEIWNWNIGAQTTVLRNSASLQRDSAYEYGVLLSGDRLDDGGFTLGYTRTAVNYQQPLPQLNQKSLFFSVRKHLYPDSTAGKITLRADAHHLNNDDPMGNTNGVRVGAAQVGYLGNDRQHYYDFAYARSNYRNSLRVNQYTPTAGFALQEESGWLQLRGYFIHLSDPALTQSIRSTRALEAKYTRWLAPGSPLKPGKIQVGALLGKRLYTVDMDAGMVANLADVQTGGGTLGAEWNLGTGTKLLLLGGQNRYENTSIGNRYRGNFMYLNLNTSW